MKKISLLSHACLLSFLLVSCSVSPLIKLATDQDGNITIEPTSDKTSEPQRTEGGSYTGNSTGNNKGNENTPNPKYSSSPYSPYSFSSDSSPEPKYTPKPKKSSLSPSTGPTATPVPTATGTANQTPAPTATATSVSTTPVPSPTSVVVTSQPGSPGVPDLGINASLNGKIPFPADNPWNQKVDSAQVDPNSDTLINSIGRSAGFHPDFGANWDGGPFGIPYIVVSGNTPKVPMTFDYSDESDPGPYPIPNNAPVEGGANSDGDRHVIVIDRDNWKLYETYYTFPSGNGYTAGSGAIFDLNSNNTRPAGWTSADAAGLPIFPGLVRYDEVVEQKAINHAIRFTVSKTRKGYIYPATHYASSNTSAALPPMGMRVRLKASFNIAPYPANIQVILLAMKTYGLILADNGSNWYFSGAPDSRWDDEELNNLKRLTGNDFEVVKMGTVVTN
jgi:hypothetical protein